MIRLGLCSGACISRDIKGVIALASATGLDAIEWAADLHIDVGDLQAAEAAMIATLRAGLTVSSFATLYRAGAEDEHPGRFDALLKAASVIQAPKMRIFAGGEGAKSRAGSKSEVKSLSRLESELRRLGDRAAEKGITLCLSMGRGTFLDRYDRASRLAAAVNHSFVRIAWEDLPDSPALEATAALDAAGRIAALVIARCSDGDGLPHAVAEEPWRARIRAFRRAEADPRSASFVLFGAVRSDGEAGEDSLEADASALRALVAEAETGHSRP